jgi:hypothetical protein
LRKNTWMWRVFGNIAEGISIDCATSEPNHGSLFTQYNHWSMDQSCQYLHNKNQMITTFN